MQVLSFTLFIKFPKKPKATDTVKKFYLRQKVDLHPLP